MSAKTPVCTEYLGLISTPQLNMSWVGSSHHSHSFYCKCLEAEEVSPPVTYRADQLRTLAGVYQLRVLARAGAGGGAAAISGIIASIN